MLGLQVHVYIYTPTQYIHIRIYTQSHITYTHLLILCISSLLHFGQVREDGGAVRVAAYHSIPCVHMAGPNELVELHCKNVGVCTTSTSSPLWLTTVCRVGWEGRVGGGGGGRVRVDWCDNQYLLVHWILFSKEHWHYPLNLLPTSKAGISPLHMQLHGYKVVWSFNLCTALCSMAWQAIVCISWLWLLNTHELQKFCSGLAFTCTSASLGHLFLSLLQIQLTSSRSSPSIRLLKYFISFCCANALPMVCTNTCQCLCGSCS